MVETEGSEAVRIAESIIDGSVPLYAGCRRLGRELVRLHVHHQDAFAPIAEVTGRLAFAPSPEDRHLWNAEVVARHEAELARWLPEIRQGVLDACREVVRQFGGCG